MNTPLQAMLGYPEILLILAIVLILFGAKKLPELARGLGSGIKEFRKATKDVQDDLQRAIEGDEETPAPPRRKGPAENTEPKSEKMAETGKAIKE